MNVAVSRAKKKFILAVTGNDIKDSNIRDLVDYITYYNAEVKESQICSIFDILYILDKAGIPLLRLSTDGSNEKSKIINASSR